MEPFECRSARMRMCVCVYLWAFVPFRRCFSRSHFFLFLFLVLVSPVALFVNCAVPSFVRSYRSSQRAPFTWSVPSIPSLSSLSTPSLVGCSSQSLSDDLCVPVVVLPVLGVCVCVCVSFSAACIHGLALAHRRPPQQPKRTTHQHTHTHKTENPTRRKRKRSC